jgi:phage shock protein E
MKSLLGVLSFIFGTGSGTPVYANTENFIVVDVRTLEEFEESHAKGALNIDVLQPDFQSQILKLDKSKVFKVYCRSGNRSGQALRTMKSLGFKNVENLGSLNQAIKKLNSHCEGISPC